MLQPVPLAEMGGLNLKERQGQQAPGTAIDLSDVWFPARGRVAERPGYVNYLSGVTAQDIHSLGAHQGRSDVRRLIVGAGTVCRVYDTAGSLVTSGETSALTNAALSFAAFGTAAEERTYIANGADALRYWEETAKWVTPSLTGTTGVGTGRHIAGWLNRLANGNFNGTASDRTPSTIRFSEPVDPHTYGTNNYVRLDPGDGDEITALVAFRQFLFAFKRRKLYVFHAVGEDADANPVFHFEPVATGVGCAGHGAACVGPDGVYFLDRSGVYRISGVHDPVRISGDVDPIFEGGLPVHYGLGGGGQLNHAQLDKARLVWHDERLYVAFCAEAATVNDRMLVWDRALDQWSLWRVPGTGLVSFRQADQPQLHAGRGGNARQVARFDADTLDDAGVAIDAYWHSAYQAYGEEGTIVMRQLKLVGEGAVQAEIGGDFQLPTSTTVIDMSGEVDVWGDGSDPAELWGDGSDPDDLWGPAPQLSEAIGRFDSVRATWHCVLIRSVAGGALKWAVDRGVLYGAPVTRRRREVASS